MEKKSSVDRNVMMDVYLLSVAKKGRSLTIHFAENVKGL